MAKAPMFLAAILSGALLAAPSSAQPVPLNEPWASLSVAQWREDLQFLAENAPLKHKNLFHSMSRAEFRTAIQNLSDAIPAMSPPKIVVALLRIGAMIEDAHSSVSLEDLALPQMPVHFIQFDDGVYVEAADPAHADLVGARLVSIGQADWSTALKKVDALVPDDPGNHGEQRAWAAHNYLNVPLILNGLGLSDSAERATFTVQKGAIRQSVTLDASIKPDGFSVEELVFTPVPNGWPSIRPTGRDIPLAMTHSNELFWLQPLPQHSAVYVSLRGVADWQGRTLANFAMELRRQLSRPWVKRVVIDLRANPGGDNTLLRPLLLTLIRARTNCRGGTWILISNKTHSAAQNFVDRLENFSDPIFVGQPTSENVNFYGDPVEIILPNSHIPVALSTLYWQDKDPRDHRVSTTPEIAVSQTFGQYVTGKDQALQIALTERAPQTLEEIAQQFASQGVSALQSAVNRYVRDPRHVYITNTEASLNRAGYTLLRKGMHAAAVTIFQVNANDHPNSSNAYDSLAESLENAGKKAEAIDAYRHAVALDPSNSHAQNALKHLAG
jgi:hypothetical protein